MTDELLMPLMVVAEEDAAAAGAVDDVPMLDARLAIASNCSISAVIEWGDNCEWPIPILLLLKPPPMPLPRCCLRGIAPADVW